MDNQRNLLLAVVFSLVVLIGYDFFFNPKTQIKNQAQLKNNQTDIQKTDENVPVLETKELSLENKIKEKRISFNSRRLEGSINLYGATMDELFLKDYFKTIEKKEKIQILSSVSSDKPYFLRLGWASTDRSIPMPGKNSLWKAEKENFLENEEINLIWTNNEGLQFNRKIKIDDNFMILIEDEVINKSGKTIEITNFSYLRRKNYRPQNKFFILHEGPLGVFNDTLKEVSYDEIEEENEIIETSTNGWIGYTDHYWQVAIFPENDQPFKARFKNLKNNPNSIQIDFLNDSIRSLQNNGSLKVKSFIFAGAKEVPLIDRYIEDLKINKLDLSVDFGWFYFLTKPLFYALHFLSGLFGNFGIGIIILTICIRIILFPLANKSFKSMNAMRILTPEIQRLRERYKDDKAKMNQEMFAMYKEKKINPASGCLPILIQIPIFFALYKVLFVSIEMRHAPFFGWIKDLSAPDPTSIFNLFGLIPWDPPIFLTIGVWPLLMGLSMYLQQKINPPPPDPIQAKIFMMLPLIFTFLLATFPSGMVVYWTVNNILSIAQQYYLLKKQKKNETV